MNYTIEQFHEDVRKEAVALKEYATQEELSRLDFDSFNPDSKSSCIYGQMTGNCKSIRASDLIFHCCKRYFHNANKFSESFIIDLQNALNKVNGETIDGVNNAGDLRGRRVWLEYLSTIESYIMTPGAKNANLIAFLKGETDNLEL